MNKRYQVTLVIETNGCEYDAVNVLKYFRHHNSFQMNETIAEIKMCGINEVKKHD